METHQGAPQTARMRAVTRRMPGARAAYKRIRAARAARRFPVIFDMLADGRMHLTGVVLLAPCLTEHTAEELLVAATRKTTKQIERLLAEHFPRPDVPTRVVPVAPVSGDRPAA